MAAGIGSRFAAHRSLPAQAPGRSATTVKEARKNVTALGSRFAVSQQIAGRVVCQRLRLLVVLATALGAPEFQAGGWEAIAKEAYGSRGG